jgi:hypothetical protein
MRGYMESTIFAAIKDEEGFFLFHHLKNGGSPYNHSQNETYSI